MKRPQEEERPKMPHLISMSDRSNLSVTGVLDVDSFDDVTIVVYTEGGQLTVKGRDLHICRLSIESGDLTVAGTVDSLTYAESKSRSGGFFGNLFR